MANIMDYLDWRGDLTLAQSEFNEIDNLILAQLVYVDLEGIVPSPESRDKITVKEASDIFFQNHTEEEILDRVSMTKTAPFVLRKMAETKRFADAKLYAYVNDISLEEQSQFSVVCVALEDKSIYVAFSGTDDTIVGWRENFNMGFLSETPGQLKAMAYLNNMNNITNRTIRVGGHSKGGNLSVYASVMCKSSVKKRIVEVYNNDGPGFKREFIESEKYQEMLPKIKTIIPESSIVGLLLEHEEVLHVVKSSNNGIQQHDAMSWEVLGTQFVYTDNVKEQSILLDETLKQWLRQLTPEQKEQIVNAIFTLLEEANIKTVDDFYHIKWKAVQDAFKARSEMSHETSQTFQKALKLLWKTGNDALKKNRLEKKEKKNSK